VKAILILSLTAFSTLFLSVGLLADQSQIKWYDDPSRYKLMDLAKCNLRVDAVEKVESIDTEGGKLAPGRKDAQLLLIKLKGNSPQDYVKTPLKPTLFAVNYVYQDRTAIALARAIGVRGKKVAHWIYKPEDTIELTLEKKGEEAAFWIAVEVPKAIDKFWIRIPAQIDEAVANVR